MAKVNSRKSNPTSPAPPPAPPLLARKSKKKSSFSFFSIPALFFFLIFALQLFFPSLFNSLSTSLPTYLDKLQSILSQQAKYPPSLIPNLPLSSSIATINWDDSADSSATISNIIRTSLPAVIRQGPVTSWSLMKWNLLEIIQSGNDIVIDQMRYQHQDPVFILGRDRDPHGMIGKPADRPLQLINSSLSQFLKTLFNETEYYYWNGELLWIEEIIGETTTSSSPSSKSDWSVFKYVDPKLSDSIQEQEDTDIWIPMIWLSHPGVVTQTHYDPQYNFLSQLQGTKRVILFPPSETSLYLYPHIHRSYRQSQLPLEFFDQNQTHPNQNLFPTLPQSGVEVVLHPGDTLFIPPYWYHRVEALTMSISVSVTSPTFLEAQFSEIYWQPLPLGPFSDSKEGKMIAAKLFLGLFLHMLQQEFHDSLRSFSQSLYLSRYHPLYSSPHSPSAVPPSAVSFQCPSYPTEESRYGKLIQEKSHDIQSVIRKSVEIFEKIQCDQEIKRNFMRDYVEEISRWAVGPEETVWFIRDCLR
jgi:hypothetical protein